MDGFARQKVPGGKLVSVKLEYTRVIKKIQILGDFFLYPEDALAEIEHALINMKISADEEELAEKIANVAKAQNIEMIGVTPEAIASTIKMAVTR